MYVYIYIYIYICIYIHINICIYLSQYETFYIRMDTLLLLDRCINKYLNKV